jgi:hypothetical protein
MTTRLYVAGTYSVARESQRGESALETSTPLDLPDLFRLHDGTRIASRADWARRRRELFEDLVPLEYGGLPPPCATESEELHLSDVRRLPGVRHATRRVIAHTQPTFSFLLYLTIPAGEGPFPVVLTGDLCWRYATDEVVEAVLGRGYILAQFNRVELAPDVYSAARTSGLYTVCRDGVYGALAAWAWGYHRCVDALLQLGIVDAERIAIVGHSRGGKTALLAGATDERIALTSANNSGAGGAGCYRRQGPNSETLADNVNRLGYWYGPRLRDYVGREGELPFDQHYLKALVAPRALLTTEALGDLWANPTGTALTHAAAREAWRFLDAEENLGIWYREGGHNHGLADWNALLDFADWRLRGVRPPCAFDANPFPGLAPAHAWSAPPPV